MLSSKTKRELKIDQRQILIDSIEIGIPSTQQILAWGERTLPNGKKAGLIKNSKTVNYKRFTPFRDGLFCERIFGPVTSFVCACGKKQPHSKISFCEKCEVEYIDQRSRRYRLGYISLLSPVTHIWYLKGRPSYLSLFLGKRKKTIVSLAYCNAYLVEHGISKRENNTKTGDMWSSMISLSTTQDFLQTRDLESKISLSHVPCPYSVHPSLTFGVTLRSKVTPRVSAGQVALPQRVRELGKVLAKMERGKLGHVRVRKTTTRGHHSKELQSKFQLGTARRTLGVTLRSKVTPSVSEGPKGQVASPPRPSVLDNYGAHQRQRAFLNIAPQNFEKSLPEGLGAIAPAPNLGVTLQSKVTPSVRPGGSNFAKQSYTKINNFNERKLYLSTSYGTRFYARQHTLPFLPTLISHFYLRDALLNFTYSLPTHEDIPLMEYCNIKRWEPLRDVHKFMAHRTVETELSHLRLSSKKRLCHELRVCGQSILKKTRAYKTSKDNGHVFTNRTEFPCFSWCNFAKQSSSNLPLPLVALPPAQHLLCKAEQVKARRGRWQSHQGLLALHKPPKARRGRCNFASPSLSHQGFVWGRGLSHQSSGQVPEHQALRAFGVSAAQIFDLRRIARSASLGTSTIREKWSASLVSKSNLEIVFQNLVSKPWCNFAKQSSSHLPLRAKICVARTSIAKGQRHCNVKQTKTKEDRATKYKAEAKQSKERSEEDARRSSKGRSLSGLESTAIREILSYTGGGALQRLLQQFDQHDLCKFLFAEAQILRVVYESCFAHFLNRFAGETIKSTGKYPINCFVCASRASSALQKISAHSKQSPYKSTQSLQNRIRSNFARKKRARSPICYRKIRKRFLGKAILYPLYKLDTDNVRVVDKVGVPKSTADLLREQMARMSAKKEERKSNCSLSISNAFAKKKAIRFGVVHQSYRPLLCSAHTTHLRCEGNSNRRFVTHAGLYGTEQRQSRVVAEQTSASTKQRKGRTGKSTRRIEDFPKKISLETLHKPWWQSHRPLRASRPWRQSHLPLRAFTCSALQSKCWAGGFAAKGKGRLLELCFAKLHQDLQSNFLLKNKKAIYLTPDELQNKVNDLRKKQIVRLSRRIYKIARRLKVTQLLTRNHRRPEWMILSHLPVLPPDLRPILQMSEKVIVASDLNVMYQRVIYRNNRHLRVRFIDFHLVTAIQRLVQDAVDRLIENGKGGSKPYYTQGGRPLKSLSDILKGKKGRFRLNLLGKRVDFSGRSVIVVSPSCKIHECGLPKAIALELYHYFLLRQLIVKKHCASIVTAKKMIKSKSSLMWDILRELMYHHPVLLNRAPTLHRLGIQAFQPKLVLGNAILLHPLVCSGFNADFDGDQMGVHLPLSFAARAESWDLLWSRNNLLSPATGQPMLVPSQDMVLGFYYITAESFKNVIAFKEYEQTFYKKKRTSFFSSTQAITTAFQNGNIKFHHPVWLDWNGKLENEEISQTPLELRVHCFGVQQSLYEKYIYSNRSRKDLFNKNGRDSLNRVDKDFSNRALGNSALCINTKIEACYVRTTAGRILMNSLLDI